jgi:hypothetical protein
MIKRALIFLVTLSAISVISHSCIFSRRFETTYEWVGFTARLMCTSVSWGRFVEPGATIAKNDFAIYITMEDNRLGRRQITQHGNFNVIPQAMALTLPVERCIRTNTITSITVKTMYDYSDVFPAGADITSLFKAAHHRFSLVSQNPIMTIEALISDFKDNQTRMEQGGWCPTTNFFLFLTDDTGIGGKQRFEISITLDDGLVLVQETSSFILE